MAAACPTGGALGPCRGRSPGSPRGEGVACAAWTPSPGSVHVCTHTHTCVGARATRVHCHKVHTRARYTVGTHAVCVSQALHAAHVTHTAHVHTFLHSHAHACFPAPRAPGFLCPAQPHHQALSASITAGSDCSHEIKGSLLLGRKVVANLDSISKSRNITLLTKVHLVKAMVFPVVMSGCESWTVKKAECQTTDAFELWCWRRVLRVP